MFDYDKYESECNKIIQINKEYLSLFENELIASSLAPKTIHRHLSNVDFYINTYLLREQPNTMDKGIYGLEMFLGFFFIRKCGWSTPNTIRTNATSIKKFYKCMMEHGKIQESDYKFLCNDIKENIRQWQETCAIYNNPDAPNPFELEW